MNRLITSIALIMAVIFAQNALAIEVNDDGRELIQQAAVAYAGDMRDRPVVTDPVVTGYVDKLARSLIPEGKKVPEGVTLTVTVIESERPELYSYTDGHIVITTGALYSMQNEAQLAGILSHEVAHVVEGHYIGMYQQIKAAERRERYKAAAGAVFSSLLDVAVDYAVDVEEIKQSERLFKGEATYSETMKRMAAVHAARGAYYSVKDVVDAIPAKDESGQWLDPRQRFEAVADVQGMEYVALAGYDAGEVSNGWGSIQKIHSQQAREREQAMGAFGGQVRQMQSMMELSMQRLRQSLGSLGLVQTISDAPDSRAVFVSKLTNLKEVEEARAKHGSSKGSASYLAFVRKVLLPKAEKALAEERYDEAYPAFNNLYRRGDHSPAILYGVAKSKLGDFAFSASEADKRAAEKLYRQAAAADKRYALPYRGLGELYEDWERYGEAADAYATYLKRAPRASDASRIKRKVTLMKRKAAR